MMTTKKLIYKVNNLNFLFRKYSQKAYLLNSKPAIEDGTSLIRNIGILAHIDAGKTTTTERMLFFSGTISHMGEVHHGNTVTDFMEQEQERGITITSASVTFQWNKHKINLLDTPGHIDFTMEVEQTLSVMDGAVVILDGSAGVEAQTITVWKQADRFQIPRIIYVNKMDKPNAELLMCKESIIKQLRVTPLVTQYPIIDADNIFKGVVNLLNLKKFEWENTGSNISFTQKELNPEDGLLWEKSMDARVHLIESLADLDDNIAEEIITKEEAFSTLSAETLKESINRICLDQKGVPVFCGSSYKNVGVQCLLDGIVDYLPSPISSKSVKVSKCFGSNLCAKAFKVRHDNHKGPIVFFRIYSGHLEKGQRIYNVQKQKPDHCDRLYIAYADDYEEVPRIGMGNVVAVSGLKETSTGQIVTSSSSALTGAEKNSKGILKEILSEVAVVPEPVFFCSIEAPSLRLQTSLDKALAALEREDPSLRVSVNEETGQTVLGGMGELHLEIIRDRIRKEYKVDADLGPLQIAYREQIIDSAKDTFHIKHQMGNTQQSVTLTLSTMKLMKPLEDKLLLDRSPQCIENIDSIFPKHLMAVKNGVEKALECGPKLLCPVMNVAVKLHWLEVGKGTSDSIITSATIQSVKKLFKATGTHLLEPIMNTEIICSEKEMESVLNDLSRRRAQISGTEIRGSDLVIHSLVPLSELLGYATDLRILTSGRASFSMEFHCFRVMTAEEEAKAIKSVTGF